MILSCTLSSQYAHRLVCEIRQLTWRHLINVGAIEAILESVHPPHVVFLVRLEYCWVLLPIGMDCSTAYLR